MSEHSRDSGSREHVTFEIAGRLFGAAVSEVHDVFKLQALTPVPLARQDVAGLLNLRGRIVTAIDARLRLGLPPREGGYQGATAIGIERDGEPYGLVIDRIGEVMRLGDDQFEPTPNTLDERWKEVARGVYRLPQGLLVAIDVARMLDPPAAAQAA